MKQNEIKILYRKAIMKNYNIVYKKNKKANIKHKKIHGSEN